MSAKLTRIISALILGNGALLFCLYAHGPWVYALGMVIVILASIEWKSFFSPRRKWLFFLLAGMLAISSCAFLVYPHLFYSHLAHVLWMAAFLVIFSVLTLAMLMFQCQRAVVWFSGDLISFVTAYVLLLVFLFSSYALSYATFFSVPLGFWLIYPILLAVCSDSAAYFCGSKWRGAPLARNVSPNKTLSGLLGGLFFGFLCSLVTCWIIRPSSFVEFVCISLATIGVSVVGDLNISFLKRIHLIKDSGDLIPGHGGLLDRLDSVMPAVVVFYLMVTSFNYFHSGFIL